MRERILSKWVFLGLYLFGLALLLLNDFILKSSYSNAVTGKLSDFAGLFLLPVFLVVISRSKTKILFFLIGTLFVLWKMPVAEGFIEVWNDLFPLTIRRVADPTDFVALLSLPVAYYLVKIYEVEYFRSAKYIGVALVSLFAFSATSYYQEIPVDDVITLNKDIVEVKKRLMVMDSLEWPLALDTTSISPDTLSVGFTYDFCFNGFDADLIIAGDSLSTTITIVQVIHDCPLNKDKIWGWETRDDKEILSRVVRKRLQEALK